MNTALTIGLEHGSGRAHLLAGPEKPGNEHRADLKAIQGESHEMFMRIEIWESAAGVVKYRNFTKPGTAEQTPSKPAPKKAKAVA